MKPSRKGGLDAAETAMGGKAGQNLLAKINAPCSKMMRSGSAGTFASRTNRTRSSLPSSDAAGHRTLCSRRNTCTHPSAWSQLRRVHTPGT